MATYVVLVDFTDEGIRGIHENWPRMSAEFVELAEAVGVRVRQIY